MSLAKHVTATPGNHLSIKEAAKLSNLTESELEEHVNEGRLPAVKTDEGLKFEQRDIEKLTAPKS